MNKKLLAMMSAMVMCFSAVPLQSVHAETDDNILNPYCAETYVDVMPKIPVDVQSVLPEWIPQTFTEALHFDNKYGKTHIEDGLICCVRKKYNYDDSNNYLTEYSGDDSCGLLTLFNETYNFVMPEKPDESDEEAYQEYLDFLYKNNIPEFYAENDLVYVDFEYEVTVYAMNPTSSVEINWIEKHPQLDRIVKTTTLSFKSSEDGEITETDLYGWLPDTEYEGDVFTEKYGEISVHDGYIVFCGDVCWDGGYSLIFEQDGTAKLELVKEDASSETNIIPVGGARIVETRVYKPVTSGTVKVTFKKAQNWTGGHVGETIVKCYNVDEDGNITEIDESEVTPLNMGDCNLDGKFGVADVVMLQKWLVGSGEITCWQNVDFNDDNRVDVFDLILMKKALMENLPSVSQESEEVTDSDIAILKEEVLRRYPDTDMSDFTFVYEPDHNLNHQFNGKLFSVYYKGVLLHGYGNINTDGNVYAVIKNEKNNCKSVEMNFIIDPELFKEIDLNAEYLPEDDVLPTCIDVQKPELIIYVDFYDNNKAKLAYKAVGVNEDCEYIIDAFTGEPIEWIPYYVV